jgi:hypothetical protein
MLAGIWTRMGAVGVEYCSCGGSKLETRRENLAQSHISSSMALREKNKPSPFGKQNKIAEKFLCLPQQISFDAIPPHHNNHPPPQKSHIHRGVLVFPKTTKKHVRVSLNIRISYFTVISQSQHQSFHVRYIDLNNTHNIPCFNETVSSIKAPFYTSDIM